MTDINGFIWDSIYKASIKAGATELSARMQAGAGTKKYKCGQFKTTSKLIKECIIEACKQKKKAKTVFSKKSTLIPVIDELVKTPAQEQIQRIKQQAKAPPAATQSTTGSKDGLWSTDIRGKK
jgi:hypothetical protein